jgi:hypothetical protein
MRAFFRDTVRGRFPDAAASTNDNDYISGKLLLWRHTP